MYGPPCYVDGSTRGGSCDEQVRPAGRALCPAANAAVRAHAIVHKPPRHSLKRMVTPLHRSVCPSWCPNRASGAAGGTFLCSDPRRQNLGRGRSAFPPVTHPVAVVPRSDGPFDGSGSSRLPRGWEPRLGPAWPCLVHRSTRPSFWSQTPARGRAGRRATSGRPACGLRSGGRSNARLLPAVSSRLVRALEGIGDENRNGWMISRSLLFNQSAVCR